MLLAGRDEHHPPQPGRSAPGIARFSFDVAFGRKAEMFEIMNRFAAVEKELGFPEPEVLVGSIGTPESRIETNHRFESLSALEATWAKLDDPRMADFQKAMAPFVVPGSHRWEILPIHE